MPIFLFFKMVSVSYFLMMCIASITFATTTIAAPMRQYPSTNAKGLYKRWVPTTTGTQSPPAVSEKTTNCTVLLLFSSSSLFQKFGNLKPSPMTIVLGQPFNIFSPQSPSSQTHQVWKVDCSHSAPSRKIVVQPRFAPFCAAQSQVAVFYHLALLNHRDIVD